MAAKKKAAKGKLVKTKKPGVVKTKGRVKVRIVKRGVKLAKKDKGCLHIPKAYRPRIGAMVVVKGTKGIAGVLDSIVGDLCNIIVGGKGIEIVPLKSVRRATKDEERTIGFFLARISELTLELSLAKAVPERNAEPTDDPDNDIAIANLKKAEAVLNNADDLSVLYAAYAQRPKSQQVTERAEDVEG